MTLPGQSWGCNGAGNATCRAQLLPAAKAKSWLRAAEGHQWVLTPSPSLSEGQSLSPAPEQPEPSMDVNLMAQENEVSRNGPAMGSLEPEAGLVPLSPLLPFHQLLCKGPSSVPSLPACLPVLLMGTYHTCQQQDELGWVTLTEFLYLPCQKPWQPQNLWGCFCSAQQQNQSLDESPPLHCSTGIAVWGISSSVV